MPIYDYYCGACDNQFEMLNAVDERDKPVCPYCGADGGIVRPPTAPGAVRGPTPRHYATPSPTKALVKREDS